MASLSQPHLSIKLLSGTSNAEVTATVNVSLTQFELNLVKNLGLKFKLRCQLRGADSGFNGADDDLFTYTGKSILAGGTSTFKATMSRNTLDEDWVGDDEVYARFTLQSAEPIFPLVLTTDSPIITGSF